MSSPLPPNENTATPASGRRPASLRHAQRKQLSRLLSLGHSQSECANILGISESTVSREVAHLRDKFKEEAVQNLPEQRAGELAKLAEIEQAAWLLHSKKQSNEALNTLLRCIRTRATVLGLDSPGMAEVAKRYEEGRELLMQAALDVLGHDHYLLERLANRIDELERQRDGGPVVVEAEELSRSKLSLVTTAPPETKLSSVTREDKPAPPRQRVRVIPRKR